MNNPMSMLLNMAMQNSNIANNPRAQEMLSTISPSAHMPRTRAAISTA